MFARFHQQRDSLTRNMTLRQGFRHHTSHCTPLRHVARVQKIMPLGCSYRRANADARTIVSEDCCCPKGAQRVIQNQVQRPRISYTLCIHSINYEDAGIAFGIWSSRRYCIHCIHILIILILLLQVPFRLSTSPHFNFSAPFILKHPTNMHDRMSKIPPFLLHLA